jgi:outer membrane protein assembly factor BamA
MKDYKINILFLLTSLNLSINVLAQETRQQNFPHRLWRKIVDEDSVRHRHHGLILNPLFYYTPETRFAFGISSVYYFRTNKKDTLFRPSVIHPFFGITQNHQQFVEAPFQLFFKKENYYLFGEIAFYNYPYKFFGIGNKQPIDEEELYNALYPSCSLTVLKKIIPKLYAGFRYNFDYFTIKPLDTDKLLTDSAANITGKNGGLNNGIGLHLLYDSRDNIFSSTKGSYIEFMSIFDSKKITFSDYTYQWFVFDVRKFIPFKGRNVLALQYYINLMAGNPPFYQMALLGGTKRMRGYYEGRYRDNNITSTQIEYRSAFWRNRLGFAAFAGCGMVFHDFKTFDLHYLKPSVGGGIRLRFDRKEKINFRIDIAYGKSLNYYFVLSEAF